jgi:hypothetical protein
VIIYLNKTSIGRFLVKKLKKLGIIDEDTKNKKPKPPTKNVVKGKKKMFRLPTAQYLETTGIVYSSDQYGAIIRGLTLAPYGYIVQVLPSEILGLVVKLDKKFMYISFCDKGFDVKPGDKVILIGPAEVKKELKSVFGVIETSSFSRRSISFTLPIEEVDLIVLDTT